MVQVLKRWDIPQCSYGSYPKIAAKRPQSISIGFEWEVQTNEEEEWDCTGKDEEFKWSNNFVIDKYSRMFAKLYQFKVHGECMAAEFCSPVAQNLETIKAVARKLQRRVSKDKFLEPDYAEMAGIHVHTSIKGAGYYEYSQAFSKAALMLNRTSSEDFVWSFSGRSEGGSEYEHQGRATCWDYGDYPCEDDALDEIEGNEMLRMNQFEESTIEYRLWHGVTDRLQPALEFAHACTKFVAQHEGVDVPYLIEFKTWLFKQKGYKLLKSQPEWAFVK